MLDTLYYILSLYFKFRDVKYLKIKAVRSSLTPHRVHLCMACVKGLIKIFIKSRHCTCSHLTLHGQKTRLYSPC